MISTSPEMLIEHWKSNWNLALEAALDAEKKLQQIRNICENSNPTYKIRIQQILQVLANQDSKEE